MKWAGSKLKFLLKHEYSHRAVLQRSSKFKRVICMKSILNYDFYGTAMDKNLKFDTNAILKT